MFQWCLWRLSIPFKKDMMHCFNSIFSVFVFSITLFCSDTPLMAKETWTINQTIQTETGSEKTSPINYEISEYASSIKSEKETVFIDYESMQLYRLSSTTKACKVFAIDVQEVASRDQMIAARVRVLMAEISARNNGEKRKIKNQDCTGMDVLLGAGLLRMRTAAPITLDYMGQSFVEITGKYWVNSSIASWQTLQKMISYRQAAFSINPLLKRIDPLGLMGTLGGFPVEGVEQSKGRRIENILVNLPLSDSSALVLPFECQGVF